jgi:hypothetical protein
MPLFYCYLIEHPVNHIAVTLHYNGTLNLQSLGHHAIFYGKGLSKQAKGPDAIVGTTARAIFDFPVQFLAE